MVLVCIYSIFFASLGEPKGAFVPVFFFLPIQKGMTFEEMKKQIADGNLPIAQVHEVCMIESTFGTLLLWVVYHVYHKYRFVTWLRPSYY